MKKLCLAPKTLMSLVAAAILAGCTATNNAGNSAPATDAENSRVMEFLEAIVLPENGIGAREAGSEKEQKAADYIKQQFTTMGLDVSVHEFKHPILDKKGQFLDSSNIIAEKKGQSDKVLVLGAHFDSTAQAKGSEGAMDNGAGVSVMLTVAEQISKLDSVPYTVRFLAFGAEEIGLVGVKKYMDMLNDKPGEVEKIMGMVNLDTVAGGDKLYVHSAHSTPYRRCGDTSKYSFETWMREGVLAASIEQLGVDDAHKIHPPFPGFPEGETGGWSDHAPFACNGIPIAYIETTNFAINGKDGYDGYSQSVSPGLWDCFDPETMTACDRETETKWGRIWHEQHDILPYLQQQFPGRIEQQLNANVKVLTAFFSNPDQYIPK